MTNPFKQKPINLDKTVCSWDKLALKPYDKYTVDAFTKTRIILMNGTEFEQNWYMHNMSRHTDNNDLRRDIAYLRRLEQMQQKKIASLKPIDESILLTTIGYEQLAVDLTAALAMNEPNAYVKAALDFALLEDFDHLYRYADLLEHDMGIKAENLVGNYTEIMPARPTISHHRNPYDEVRRHVCSKKDELITNLNVNIITAAEQQTMNYYMNVGQFYGNEYGRKLYTEIAMVEETHVTEYGSLIDTNCTWLEGLLMHEYVECYLYYSCYMDECDEYVRKIWQELYEEEVAHLHFACDLLRRYEKKDPEEVIPCGDFPKLLTFQSNIDYVRGVIAKTVTNTALHEDYADVCELDSDAGFFKWQESVNPNVGIVPSHNVIDMYIVKNGTDYRYQVAEHPIKSLQDRQADNTNVGRVCECE